MDKKAVMVMLTGEDSEERFLEMVSLCKTAGYELERIFKQKGKAQRKYLIRKGKVAEIRNFITDNEVGLVIFENLLTSRQILSLEDELKIPVVDRFDLILNVFELHAQSKEAKLQIELARLKRKMPYIKMYLSRKVKTEHPGFGGSGEFIIHSTLTTIHRRIKSIEKTLEGFEKRTEAQRMRRKRVGKIVSLAGYTNVGKTSLLYALTGVKKPARDELFTTLRTKTAAYSLNGSRYLVNDTIGFIRNLPYQLIHAFNSTLKDISSSDLILIVHDASLQGEELVKRMDICHDTLMNIGAGDAIWLEVENKIDLGRKNINGTQGVSAKTGAGINSLKKEIQRLLKDD
jgi:GTP-binding protein HflX